MVFERPNSDQVDPGDSSETGLRGRKKARRRQEILDAAGHLFAINGFDATTLADIAQETGVSPPTVSNYFGSKENILSALIFEGAERERTNHMNLPRETGKPFAEVLGAFLVDLTAKTMQIAGKRVWRYAEAANIRRPQSEFERQFTNSDLELRKLIGTFMSDYDMVLRNGTAPDPDVLSRLFYDTWTMCYFSYIKNDAMTFDAHRAEVMQAIAALVALVFDDGFAAISPLKRTKEAR